MKLIKPYYKILTPINGEEILKAIELAARTCYQSEDKISNSSKGIWSKCLNCKIEHTTLRSPEICGINFKHCNNSTEDYTKIGGINSYRLLIPKLISNHHEAMLEFGGMITVRFVVDRGVTHELVRHRIASFAQESTRYCNYEKDEHITFIIPSWCINIPDCSIFDRVISRTSEIFAKDEEQFISYLVGVERLYKNLITGHDWTPQQARSVLPNSLKSEINLSANIREWRHIFKLRTAKTAHPQMKEVMCPLLDEFKSKIPILFDDINYESKN